MRLVFIFGQKKGLLIGEAHTGGKEALGSAPVPTWVLLYGGLIRS